MYVSVKLLNKIFKCNLKHMLQGHKCNVSSIVEDEFNELRIKFALFAENISKKEIITYLCNNPLLIEFQDYFSNINSELCKLSEKDQKSYLNKLNIENELDLLRQKLCLNNSEIEKINYLYKIFNEALSGLKTNSQDFLLDLQTYNYKNINEKVIKLETDYKSKNVSIFKKAFFLYKIGNFVSSYNELKKIAYETSKNRNYLLYVIASMYQYYLGQLIDNYYSFDKSNSQEINDIINEYKKIEIFVLIDKYIQKDLKESLKFITDLSYFKDVASDIRKCNDEIQKMYHNAKKGSWGFNNTLSVLYEHINDINNFMFNNYFVPTNIYECCQVYKLFINGILYAYAVENVSIDNDHKYSGGMPYFDLFDFYIMIEYGKYDDIQKICDEYNIKYFKLIDKTVKENILKILPNIITNLKDKNIIFNYSEKIKVLLFILSKIQLEKTEVKLVIDNLIAFYKINFKEFSAENYNFYMAKNKMFSDFISTVYNNTSKKISIFNPEQLGKLLICIIKENYKLDYSRAKVTDTIRILHIISYILLNRYKKFRFSNTNEIMDLLREIQDKKLRLFINCRVFKLIDNKENIKKDIDKTCKSLSDDDFIQFVEDLLYYGILKPTRNIQQKIIKIANDALVYQIKNITLYSGEDKLFAALNCICYLLKLEKWKLNKELNEFIKLMQKEYSNTFVNRENWWKNNYIYFLNIINLYINIETINFEDIDIKIFSSLNKKLIANIKNEFKTNTKVKEILLRKVLSLNMENEFLKKNMESIIFD